VTLYYGLLHCLVSLFESLLGKGPVSNPCRDCLPQCHHCVWGAAACMALLMSRSMCAIVLSSRSFSAHVVLTLERDMVCSQVHSHTAVVNRFLY
jgi:hypothetical protein